MGQRFPEMVPSKLALYLIGFIACLVGGVGFFIYDLVRLMKYGMAAGLPFLTTLMCAWVCWVFWGQIRRLRQPPGGR